MSEKSTPDISKVISLIMSNPKLIEEISALARSEGGDTTAESEVETSAKEDTTETVAAYTPPIVPPQRQARSQLLCALKPYVSKERAQAIDSMITIADIFDTMKGR